MTAEPRRHDCPNCDPTPAVSTETVRGGRRLGTPADHDHPVPDPAAHAQARYDTDLDALAWARGLSAARRSTEQMLLGGTGCVVGAFDARRPEMLAAPSDADGASAADTLPEWLNHRYGRNPHGWDTMPDDERAYWVHEAAAVRRAVARGGFKTAGGGV